MQDYIDSIIKTYGLFAVYLGIVAEGETVALVAGFLAHRGDMDLSAVLLVALLATVSGDNLFFYVGRYAGKPFLKKLPFLDTRVKKIKKVFCKKPFLITMVFRAMYGLRIATPLVIGMSRFSRIRFFLMDFVSSLAWSVSYVCAGYLFGHLIDRVFDDARKYELWVVLGLLAAGITGFIIYFIRHMKSKRSEGELVEIEEIDKFPTLEEIRSSTENT